VLSTPPCKPSMFRFATEGRYGPARRRPVSADKKELKQMPARSEPDFPPQSTLPNPMGSTTKRLERAKNNPGWRGGGPLKSMIGLGKCNTGYRLVVRLETVDPDLERGLLHDNKELKARSLQFLCLRHAGLRNPHKLQVVCVGMQRGEARRFAVVFDRPKWGRKDEWRDHWTGQKLRFQEINMSEIVPVSGRQHTKYLRPATVRLLCVVQVHVSNCFFSRNPIFFPLHSCRDRAVTQNLNHSSILDHPHFQDVIIFIQTPFPSPRTMRSKTPYAPSKVAARIKRNHVPAFFSFLATLNTPPVPAPQAAQLGFVRYRFSAQDSQK